MVPVQLHGGPQTCHCPSDLWGVQGRFPCVWAGGQGVVCVRVSCLLLQCYVEVGVGVGQRRDGGCRLPPCTGLGSLPEIRKICLLPREACVPFLRAYVVSFQMPRAPVTQQVLSFCVGRLDAKSFEQREGVRLSALSCVEAAWGCCLVLLSWGHLSASRGPSGLWVLPLPQRLPAPRGAGGRGGQAGFRRCCPRTPS